LERTFTDAKIPAAGTYALRACGLRIAEARVAGPVIRYKLGTLAEFCQSSSGGLAIHHFLPANDRCTAGEAA